MSDQNDSANVDQGWAELADWGRDPRLSELDALMWRTDRHPSGSWSGVVLHLLDRAPDWDRLRAAHEWFIEIVPRFGQRIVEPTIPIGTPHWADDPAFDLDFHLRRVSLAAPGDERQLLDLLQTIALTPLDRTRPPWEGIVIEGLEGGRAAYALHAHHVFMDGMALARLHERILNPGRDHIPSKKASLSGDEATVSPLDVAGQELAKLAHDAPAAAAKLTDAVIRGVRQPGRTASYLQSMLRVANPPANPSAILAGGARRAWRFGMLDCDLADLRTAAKSAGGSVNDGFVCALLGGLRHYCAEFGEELEDVPLSMPVSMRAAADAKGGNEFAAAYFLAPTSVADPAARIAEMRARVKIVRGEPALNFVTRVTPLLNRMPGGIAASLLGSIGNAVLTTSSWPGLTVERYMTGARFEQMYVFAPLPGTAMTAAMTTHLGTCCIAINADGDVFHDIPLLWECLQRGLDEVLALATPRDDA